MDLDLRDLEVFLAVDRQGSFGRAAADLLVSQPAVSERIRHLERLVGPVFERTSRGAVLTPAGEALLPYARRCLALAGETVDVARQAGGSRAMVVAVHSTFAQRVVPYVLGTLAALPRRVTIRDVHSEEVQPLLIDGAAHLGFALSGAVARGLRRRALPPDRVVAVAAPEHPVVGRSRVTVSSLTDSLVAVNSWGDGGEAFLARLHGSGIDDWRIRYCADAATAVALATDHGHVALVTRSAAASSLNDGRLHRVPLANLSGWVVRLDLLHRTTDVDDMAIRTLVDAIDQA